MEKIAEQIAGEVLRTLMRVEDTQASVFAEKIIQAKRIFCAGRGRSGLIMQTMAMRLMHLGFVSHFVGEVTQPAIRAGDLLLIASSSGETSSMVSIAQRSKELGVEVALFTSSKESSLAKLADEMIFIPAKEVKSYQPDGNLFEQSLFVVCDAVAIEVKETLHIEESTMDSNHTNLE